MVLGKIDKPATKLLTITQQKDSSDVTFDDIRISLHLLKHRSVYISQEVDIWLKGPPCLAMDCKMDIRTSDNGPSDSSSNYRSSLTTYQNAHSGIYLLFKHSFFCYSIAFYRHKWCSAHFFNCIRLLALYSKPKRNSLAVAWPLLPRCSGPANKLYLVMKS